MPQGSSAVRLTNGLYLYLNEGGGVVKVLFTTFWFERRKRKKQINSK